MSKHAAQNVVQANVAMIECSFTVPRSVRNDAIWVAEHMRRRHLLLREEELAECSSGLCVLVMGLKWAYENCTKVYSKLDAEELTRDTSRDDHRSLIVPQYLLLCIQAVRTYSNGAWSSERALGAIARSGVSLLHCACEEGAIDPVIAMHRAVESDPLWSTVLRENRARDAQNLRASPESDAHSTETTSRPEPISSCSRGGCGGGSSN